MVAVRRIETFLDEEEVTEQVSSLKKTSSPDPSQRPDQDSGEWGLGIENGTFKWNEVPDNFADQNSKSNAKNKGKANGQNNGNTTSGVPSPTGPSSPGDETVASASVISVETDAIENKFELKNISVRFPVGELTVITGPTASGKTAMLVRTVHIFNLRS